MATPDDDTLECTLLSAPSSKKEAAGGAWWHSNAHTIVLRGASMLGASELGRRAVAELRGGCVCGDGACTCTPPSEGTFGQEIGLSARIVVAGEGAGRRESLALVSDAELNAHLAAGDKPPFRVCDLVVFYDTAAQREGSTAPVNAMLADALRYAFGDDHALLRRPLRGNVILAAELLSDSADRLPGRTGKSRVCQVW